MQEAEELPRMFDLIPYTDAVEQFCWRRFAHSASELTSRFNARRDRVVEDSEAYTIYRYGATSVCYMIVDSNHGCGLRIVNIWDESESD